MCLPSQKQELMHKRTARLLADRQLRHQREHQTDRVCTLVGCPTSYIIGFSLHLNVSISEQPNIEPSSGRVNKHSVWCVNTVVCARACANYRTKTSRSPVVCMQCLTHNMHRFLFVRHSQHPPDTTVLLSSLSCVMQENNTRLSVRICDAEKQAKTHSRPRHVHTNTKNRPRL